MYRTIIYIYDLSLSLSLSIYIYICSHVYIQVASVPRIIHIVLRTNLHRKLPIGYWLLATGYRLSGQAGYEGMACPPMGDPMDA